MHQLLRLAMRGDEIEPAPGDVQRIAETKDAIGQRIAMMVIVEQPAIEVGFPQRGLNRFKIHRKVRQRWLILNSLQQKSNIA